MKDLAQKAINNILYSVKQEDKALRYDSNKNRLELIPPILLEEVGKILSFGAKKYDDNNWMKGMKWSRCIGSLKRHLLEFEKGNDYDDESHEYHLSHVIVNAMFILHYYKTHPELDDRIVNTKPRIGLDIDEVIADWLGLWCEHHQEDRPEFWNFDKDIKEKFDSLRDNKDFWLSIKPKINPSELSFEPVAYITSRNIPTEWTEEWLKANKFPAVPVYTVGHNQSKIEACRAANVDIFVDDRWENYMELNQAGICCYLMDALHNRRYNVGYRRIYDLKGF